MTQNDRSDASTTSRPTAKGTRKAQEAVVRAALGGLIATAREDRGLTQVTVAKHFGRPSSAISRLEAGINGFRGGFAQRVLEYLDGLDLKNPNADPRPLEEQAAEIIATVGSEMTSAASEGGLDELLHKYQSARALNSLALHSTTEARPPSFDVAALTLRQVDDSLRSAKAATRSAFDRLVFRADQLPDVEARLYLAELRSILATLENIDTRAFQSVEIALRNLTRSSVEGSGS